MPIDSRPPAKGSFVLQCIALKKDLSQKEIGSRIKEEYKEVSRQLRKEVFDDRWFPRILHGIEGTPSEVAGATACYEALEPDPDLTDEERAVIEAEILARSRRDREALKRLALRSRDAPPLDVYPGPADVEPARWRDGRTAEVKALAPRLAELFTAKGVHREVLVALRIFHEALEAETATADLARRVLRFLFRARHDQGLRFSLG